MTSRTVTTQAELDKAVADKVDWIDIRSPIGVWIEVRACDSSTVLACGSSTVLACGSSTVSAYGSSTVRACDSSTVSAYGSSTVSACDSSTVTACDSSTVRATPLVAVHLHSATVNVAGGVILDHSNVAGFDAREWCEYHGVEVKRGIATVFKAVNAKWTTDRGTNYSPGSKPKCDDFRDTGDCGGGLHFGPTPLHAMAYHPGATRFVSCGIRLSEMRPISGGAAKCKAPRVVRACVEVDIDGKAVQS